jgi:predicted metalloprotease
MKFTKGYRSADVEDRRGKGGGGKRAGKFGIGGTILGLVVFFAFGQDYLGVMNSGSGGDAPAAQEAGDRDKEDTSQIQESLDLMQAFWSKTFSQNGLLYQKAKLVLFWDQVDTGGCGGQSSAVGPFYCPGDNKAYVDVSFFKLLKERFGAAGDFATIYVLAHEIGHHLQAIAPTEHGNSFDKNEASVRQELQADCYAGVWAKDAEGKGLLDANDIGEALNAARSIGDDMMQKHAGQPVNQHNWTHGSSEKRKRWFRTGYQKGTMAACNTYEARRQDIY